jgi:hypothetical protein
LATLLSALTSGLLLLLAGLLLPAAALLAALTRLLAALVLTTLVALTALLTALVLILVRHFRLTPTREDSRDWTMRHLASAFLVATHAWTLIRAPHGGNQQHDVLLTCCEQVHRCAKSNWSSRRERERHAQSGTFAVQPNLQVNPTSQRKQHAQLLPPRSRGCLFDVCFRCSSTGESQG